MRVIGLVLSLLCALPLSAAAQQPTGSIGHAWRSPPPYMRVYSVTQAPYGFMHFCDRMPEECVKGPMETERFSATPERMKELVYVNWHVNQKITPASDLEEHGLVEYWTIPRTRGDCEDYALLKRKILMARGWPASALLVTVVRDEKGAGHAVLTARTLQGDFILDNKTDEVKLWHRTPYEFVMRQSYLHTMVWMSLDPLDALPQPSLARHK